MSKPTSIIFPFIALAAGLTATSVGAAELNLASPKQVRHAGRVTTPADHHVIEVASPPYGGAFVINGTSFLAQSAACFRWQAGEPVKLLTGDWHGRCTYATVYNVARRQSCPMWCGPQLAY